MQADYCLKRDKLSLDLFWIGSRARIIRQNSGPLRVANLFNQRKSIVSKIGKGYGSEYHLQQWLSAHQPELNKRVSEALSLPGRSIEWLQETRGNEAGPKEWKGIEFLSPNRDLKEQWKEFWPTGKGIHYWDAIGKITENNGPEWLLVEAKAHTDEILTDCKASNLSVSRESRTLLLTCKKGLGVDPDKDANRLATLWFLHEHKIPARLLFIYFTGDNKSKGSDKTKGSGVFLTNHPGRSLYKASQAISILVALRGLRWFQVKEQMLEMLQNQADDSSYDELLQELAFAHMVEQGLADSDAGRTISHEDMLNRMRSW